MKIPISIKLISITTLLLLLVTVPIATVTSRYFENVSRQREENVNLDYAVARATEVQNILTELVYKTNSAGDNLFRATEGGKEAGDDFDPGFMHDKDFYSIEVQKTDGTVVGKKIKNEVIKEACKCDPATVTQGRNLDGFPFDKVKEGNVEIQNTTVPNGPPMFTIGLPIAKDANGKITHIALADISLGLIQKPFSESNVRTFFATDNRGVLLAHADERRVLAKQNFTNSEIVRAAFESKTLPRSQKHVLDPITNEFNYSAYARTNYGVTVFSEIKDEIILEPAREVKRKVYFISGIVLSSALFVIFLFSLSLTSPIEKLVHLTEIVSKGNFDVNASQQVRMWFKDEVGALATSFDEMIKGLKERDKVKNLFTKFHGSSVTDDLLQGEVGLGGQRKDVLVFFSDIRGFTSFSEKRAPEEVVEMLNEYFAVMVGIINRHGGVVDKFIGDAIMAIWGAPKASDKDAENAVRACLEMRRALADLNARKIEKGQPAILIGMGLHAGPAISGTIGSSERMEYTVIGNTVNTTSRIEAATKSFGTDLLVTDDVLKLVGENFKSDYAGTVEVKGRSVPLKMFTVAGYKGENGEYVMVETPYSHYEAEAADKVKIKDKKQEAS